MAGKKEKEEKTEAELATQQLTAAEAAAQEELNNKKIEKNRRLAREYFEKQLLAVLKAKNKENEINSPFGVLFKEKILKELTDKQLDEIYEKFENGQPSKEAKMKVEGIIGVTIDANISIGLQKILLLSLVEEILNKYKFELYNKETQDFLNDFSEKFKDVLEEKDNDKRLELLNKRNQLVFDAFKKIQAITDKNIDGKIPNEFKVLVKVDNTYTEKKRNLGTINGYYKLLADCELQEVSPEIISNQFCNFYGITSDHDAINYLKAQQKVRVSSERAGSSNASNKKVEEIISTQNTFAEGIESMIDCLQRYINEEQVSPARHEEKVYKKYTNKKYTNKKNKQNAQRRAQELISLYKHLKTLNEDLTQTINSLKSENFKPEKFLQELTIKLSLISPIVQQITKINSILNLAENSDLKVFFNLYNTKRQTVDFQRLLFNPIDRGTKLGLLFKELLEQQKISVHSETYSDSDLFAYPTILEIDKLNKAVNNASATTNIKDNLTTIEIPLQRHYLLNKIGESTIQEVLEVANTELTDIGLVELSFKKDKNYMTTSSLSVKIKNEDGQEIELLKIKKPRKKITVAINENLTTTNFARALSLKNSFIKHILQLVQDPDYELSQSNSRNSLSSNSSSRNSLSSKMSEEGFDVLIEELEGSFSMTYNKDNSVNIRTNAGLPIFTLSPDKTLEISPLFDIPNEISKVTNELEKLKTYYEKIPKNKGIILNDNIKTLFKLQSNLHQLKNKEEQMDPITFKLILNKAKQKIKSLKESGKFNQNLIASLEKLASQHTIQLEIKEINSAIDSKAVALNNTMECILNNFQLINKLEPVKPNIQSKNEFQNEKLRLHQQLKKALKNKIDSSISNPESFEEVSLEALQNEQEKFLQLCGDIKSEKHFPLDSEREQLFSKCKTIYEGKVLDKTVDSIISNNKENLKEIKDYKEISKNTKELLEKLQNPHISEKTKNKLTKQIGIIGYIQHHTSLAQQMLNKIQDKKNIARNIKNLGTVINKLEKPEYKGAVVLPEATREIINKLKIENLNFNLKQSLEKLKSASNESDIDKIINDELIQEIEKFNTFKIPDSKVSKECKGMIEKCYLLQKYRHLQKEKLVEKHLITKGDKGLKYLSQFKFMKKDLDNHEQLKKIHALHNQILRHLVTKDSPEKKSKELYEQGKKHPLYKALKELSKLEKSAKINGKEIKKLGKDALVIKNISELVENIETLLKIVEAKSSYTHYTSRCEQW